MFEKLKEEVLKANLALPKFGIVIFTWGNASAISKDRKYVAIKPSGVPYEKMNLNDIVITDRDGNIIEGGLNPSTDLKTHLEIYKSFPKINSVVHTHSINATAFAQARIGIPPLGTTHADHFYGEIPCTRSLTKAEVNEDYEKNTGKVIAETMQDMNYMSIPGVLVAGHGPFTWGKNVHESVYNAVVLEKVAEIALKTLLLNHNALLEQYVLDKHYYRKHGDNAYYGQNKC